MFIELFDNNGEPILVSLLNITSIQPGPQPGITLLSTSDEACRWIRGDYKDIRNQIRGMCK